MVGRPSSVSVAQFVRIRVHDFRPTAYPLWSIPAASRHREPGQMEADLRGLIATVQNADLRALLALVFGVTIAVVVLTPWQNQFWRYLGPVAPLTLIFSLSAMLLVCQRIGRMGVSWNRIGLGVMAIVLGGTLCLQGIVAQRLLGDMPLVSYFDATGKERRMHVLAYGGDWAALDVAFQWLRTRAAKDTIVATAVPQLAYLRSGHKAVLPPFELDARKANQLLDQVPVRYLLLDNFGLSPGISERYGEPVTSQNAADWRLAFTAADRRTRIYERIR